MPVNLSQVQDASRFSGVHFTAHSLCDGRGMLAVSGVAAVALQIPSATDWVREIINLELDLGPAIDRFAADTNASGGSQVFLADQWLATVTPNAFSRSASGGVAGWAVDEFAVVQEDGGGRQLLVETHVAVRGPLSVLDRLCYHVGVIGALATTPAAPSPSPSS